LVPVQVLVTPGLGYSEQERSCMVNLALARINSFASEPDTGFPPGSAAPHDHAFLRSAEAI